MSVATVLTACGIETMMSATVAGKNGVATVLTACGIETWEGLAAIGNRSASCNSTYRLRY